MTIREQVVDMLYDLIDLRYHEEFTSSEKKYAEEISQVVEEIENLAAVIEDNIIEDIVNKAERSDF